MPRGPRYVPPGWSVEITTSTVCGFCLLPATTHFARIMVGILARAQEKYPVSIHAAVALGSHYHFIVTPDDAEQLADFMEFVNGNLAREAARIRGWRGRFWRERYHLIPISPEPEAQQARLRYLLSHSVKEHLVASVRVWEGLHCAEALIDGTPMKGVWYNRSKEYEAKRQAKKRAERRGEPLKPVSRSAFMTHYELKLALLPCWEHWSTATIRKKIADMVAEIEAEAAAVREELEIEPKGMAAVRNQNPMERAMKSKRSPIPLCHAASRAIRERVKRAYRGFVTAFREASLKVKCGRVSEAIFPRGSFPPSLPFIRSGEEYDPLADTGGSLAFGRAAPALG